MAEELMAWLLEKHHELVEKTRVAHGGEVSFAELNQRMAEYGGDYAWAISEDAIAQAAYRRRKLAFDEWYNRLFTIAKNLLPAGSSVKAIEAQIASDNRVEWQKWQDELLQLELQQNVRAQFLKVWSSLKDIYVELARNMRSDYQTAGGLSVGQTESGAERIERIKRLRRLSGKE
jgi:hypothetical protein